MEIVGSGLDSHVDGAGRANPEIARGVAGQSLKLIDRVDRRHHGHTAAAAAVVVFAAVNHPDVMFRTLSIEADVGAGTYRYGQVEIGEVRRSTRTQDSEGRHMPAVNGEILDFFAGHQVAHLARIRLDLHDIGGYRYAFGDLADFQNCIHRSEEHTSELQSLRHLVCRLLLEKKNTRQDVHEGKQVSRLPDGLRVLHGSN